jgi:hypothetical protein
MLAIQGAPQQHRKFAGVAGDHSDGRPQTQRPGPCARPDPAASPRRAAQPPLPAS